MSHSFDRKLNGTVVCSFVFFFFFFLILFYVVGADVIIILLTQYSPSYSIQDAILFIIVQDGIYALIVRRLPIICATLARFLCAKDALKVLIINVLGEAKGSVEHV